VASVDRAGVALWPTLFGYQFLFELERDPSEGSSPRG